MRTSQGGNFNYRVDGPLNRHNECLLIKKELKSLLVLGYGDRKRNASDSNNQARESDCVELLCHPWEVKIGSCIMSGGTQVYDVKVILNLQFVLFLWR